MIADPALVHETDRECGRTALIWSSIFGHVEVLKFLVECQAHVMARDNANATALHLSCCKGHMEFCKFLLECKADANATDDSGGTPLTRSCGDLEFNPGSLEVTKLLVELKADVMARTSDGAGVIEWAERFGHDSTAAYLRTVGGMEPYELYKHFGELEEDEGEDSEYLEQDDESEEEL